MKRFFQFDYEYLSNIVTAWLNSGTHDVEFRRSARSPVLGDLFTSEKRIALSVRVIGLLDWKSSGRRSVSSQALFLSLSEASKFRSTQKDKITRDRKQNTRR